MISDVAGVVDWCVIAGVGDADGDADGVVDGISIYHMPLVKFRCPVIITLSFFMMYMVGRVRTMIQLSSHSCPNDSNEDDFRAGIMWPCRPAGLKSGKGNSHTCVECMCVPSGCLMVMGWVAGDIFVAWVGICI